MIRIVTTCNWCGKEIGAFVEQDKIVCDVQYKKETVQLVHPFCNPECEKNSLKFHNPPLKSYLSVSTDGFVSEAHLKSQSQFNKKS